MRQNRHSTKMYVVHRNTISDSFRIRIVWFQPKQDSDRIQVSFFKNRIGSDSENSLSDHLCNVLRPVLPMGFHQCCHSVMKKNPRIYFEEKTENNKKPQTYSFQKSQNQTWNVHNHYFHINIKVICIVYIIFNKLKSIFEHRPPNNAWSDIKKLL